MHHAWLFLSSGSPINNNLPLNCSMPPAPRAIVSHTFHNLNVFSWHGVSCGVSIFWNIPGIFPRSPKADSDLLQLGPCCWQGLFESQCRIDVVELNCHWLDWHLVTGCPGPEARRHSDCPAGGSSHLKLSLRFHPSEPAAGPATTQSCQCKLLFRLEVLQCWPQRQWFQVSGTLLSWRDR